MEKMYPGLCKGHQEGVRHTIKQSWVRLLVGSLSGDQYLNGSEDR